MDVTADTKVFTVSPTSVTWQKITMIVVVVLEVAMVTAAEIMIIKRITVIIMIIMIEQHLRQATHQVSPSA